MFSFYRGAPICPQRRLLQEESLSRWVGTEADREKTWNELSRSFRRIIAPRARVTPVGSSLTIASGPDDAKGVSFHGEVSDRGPSGMRMSLARVW
jgi:hypothetical protein